MGKGKMSAWHLVGVGLVLIVAFFGVQYLLGSGLGGVKIKGDDGTLSISDGVAKTDGQTLNIQVGGACPDTKQTTLRITQENGLNDTANDIFNSTVELYELSDVNGAVVEGSRVEIVTTTGEANTISCGKSYRAKFLRTDANLGDNSKLLNVLSSDDGKAYVEDGWLYFTTTDQDYNVRVKGARHSVLEFKAYDRINAAFMFDNGDASATDYEADGVNFTSTTGNTTATAVGASGDFQIDLYYRANETIGEFGDYGHLVLIELGTTAPDDWDDPVVKLDGVILAEATSGALTVEEQKAFANYEHIYAIVPENVKSPVSPLSAVLNDVKRTNEHKLSVDLRARSGINPATDIEIDFAARGNFISVENGNQVKSGAARDDTSNTATYAVQDSIFDIS